MFHVVALVSLIGGLVNLYSPDLGTGTLLVGGWRDAGQTEDRIYALVSGQMVERLRRPGWSINDPSVVAAPDGSGWRCYYTALSRTPVDLALATERNWLGVARSADGVTWTDEGILVSQWNGVDLGGVWSPGALVVGDEVWVYAHSNAPRYRNYRLRLAADGRTVLGAEALTLPLIPNTPAAIAFASNLDVAPKADGTGYWMVANSADLQRIVLLHSADGLAWTWVQTLNAGGGTWVLTPHLTAVTADGFDVLFGWTESVGEWRSRSLHRWTWRR